MRRPLAAAVLTAVVVGMPVTALAASPTRGGGDGFRLADARIDESSGLALSRRHAHVVWTTNDSGDSARVFAVDTRTGRTVGVHRFGADVQDVEALAMTPEGTLLVGDIGDNGATRSSVRVYWFGEPALGETSGEASSWTLTYPDGPHDAESLAVDPGTGRFHLVTKGQPGAVYALPEHPTRTGTNRLTMVAAAPSVATDAVFLADGSALVVRTYLALVLLDPRDLHRVASAPLPAQPQGESLSLAPGGRSLLVGSEGAHSRVEEVPVPTPGPAVSTPAATSTRTVATSAAPTRAASASSPTRADPAGGGSSLSGGARAVVALAVGGVVLACLVSWGLGRVAARRP